MVTRKRPPGNRSLSDEEKQLWDQVAGQAKPLRGGKSKTAAPPPPEPARKPIRVSKSQAYIPPNQAAHLKDRPISTGAYANIDRSTAERFRKGQYPIDATLDMHGMTRDKAQLALGQFVKNQHARGSRCLLVITGKGRPEKEMSEQLGRGILREMLPVWLADFNQIVLAVDVARQQHGGSGAFYVLLRRKR